eukprot:Lithocolla_globosa_v1_NODE_69_length_7060_cov_437.109350.p2 type:complete len:105 gc:universal NODE_69_length_7060_cov_437.109350:1190-876(-)
MCFFCIDFYNIGCFLCFIFDDYLCDIRIWNFINPDKKMRMKRQTRLSFSNPIESISSTVETTTFLWSIIFSIPSNTMFNKYLHTFIKITSTCDRILGYCLMTGS